MTRQEFRAICRTREPAGWELLHWLEAEGFRVVWSPGCCAPILAHATPGRIMGCPDAGRLVVLYADELAEALAARQELMLEAGWGEVKEMRR